MQLRQERDDTADLGPRNRELEFTLENMRRKIAEERQMKDSFEALLAGMKEELGQLRDERDRLRENADAAPQIQQNGVNIPGDSSIEQLLGEIAGLKVENASLAQLQGTSYTSMAEEYSPSSRSGAPGLSLSSSLARMPSTSKKDKESRETLAERVRDIEEQRDTLHRTLRSLLFRHSHRTQEDERRFKSLETKLDQAEKSDMFRGRRGIGGGYGKEVNRLREEINQLRQRAEDALDQKWQCEKGLASLKMDLDRAEQQTSSLRMLLQEHDIAVPEELAVSRDVFVEVQITSSSLEAAFEELQADLEQAGTGPKRSSEELAASAKRVESLAGYVRQQLRANGSLRNRLADAIGQGEREQQISAERINSLQNRLKDLEERLVTAQQQSEEEMNKHEEEVARLRECHNEQIKRLRHGSRYPVALSKQLPRVPFDNRLPRLDKTTSGDAVALNEAVQVENLERKVKEMEKALRSADLEMEEVIERMNRAQIDVGELQADR